MSQITYSEQIEATVHMVSHSKPKTPDWLKLAQQLSLSNSTVRVSLAQGDMVSADEEDEEDDGCPVRLLDIRRDHLIIEKPTSLIGEAEGGEDLHRGLLLKVLLAQGQDRWYIRSKISDKTIYKIREDLGVSALVLSTPDKVINAQRRAFFRVRYSTGMGPSVKLKPIVPPVLKAKLEVEDPAVLPVPEELDGQLHDLSANGLCIELANPKLIREDIDRYFCQATLAVPIENNLLEFPDSAGNEPDEIMLHLDFIRVKNKALGLMSCKINFEELNKVKASDLEDKIVHFMAWCQRQQIKRSRGRD